MTKIYLGWAIRAIDDVGYDLYLCIFDNDLRMGLAHEKIIFTDHIQAVDQLKLMRTHYKNQWLNFDNFRIVRMFKWV